MCLAVYKPAKKTISRALLERAFNANGDGAGFAYSHKNKLIVKKGFFIFEEFWKAFKLIQKENPAIIHFRLASHGSKSKKNCHPFLINDNVAIVHNGILDDWTDSKKSTKSDTAYFVDTILVPLLERVPDAYLNPVFQYMLEKTIDIGNKMIFLDNTGDFSIIRDHAGTWMDGCWFSNEGYKISKNINGHKNENFDYDLLSEEEWLERRNKQLANFQPLNQTEMILGAPSRLGKRDNVADDSVKRYYEMIQNKKDAEKFDNMFPNKTNLKKNKNVIRPFEAPDIQEAYAIMH